MTIIKIGIITNGITVPKFILILKNNLSKNSPTLVK